MDAKARPRRGKRRTLVSLTAAAALAAVTPARAQLLPDLPVARIPGSGVEPGVTVQSRLRPAYDPLGVPVGTGFLYPEVAQSIGYDGAVRGPDGGRSLVLGTDASLLLVDRDPRHPLGLYLDLANTRTPALAAQDRTDFTAAGAATLALGAGRLSFGAAHRALHQDRTDPDALATDAPVAYRVNEAHIGYARGWGRLTLKPRLSLENWRFGAAAIGGVTAPQSYRDRDVVRLGLDGFYDLAPRRRLILAVRTAVQRYTDTPSGSATPDSRAIELLAGIDDASDGIWHYRLLAGWEHRAYRFGGYRAHDAAVGEADIVMVPGGMTTFTATLSRSIEAAAQEGVAGFVYTTARLTADYEWRRNVILEASGAVQQADLLGSSGSERVLRGGLQATWLLNRHLRVISSYDFAAVRTRGDHALGGSFVRSQFLLTLRAAL